MPFSQSFVEVDRCRTSLLRGGKGEPLLYLHGANGAGVAQPFMKKLAEQFDVLVPEHPGFGLSDEPNWLENIHDLAYFYLDFLRHLGLSGVHVVGSSIGGWLALEMAVRDSSRIGSLVLVAPSGIQVSGLQAGDIFLWTPEQLARNTFFDQALADKTLAQPLSQEQHDIAAKNRFTTARLAWEPRLHDPFLEKWLHRIDVPTQIVWGESDKILPVAYAEEFKKRMPKAHVTVIQRCGHLPQVEKADEFCEIVSRFARNA